MGTLADIVKERTTPEGQLQKTARDVRAELEEMDLEELQKLSYYLDEIEEEENTKEAAEEAVAAGLLMAEGLNAGMAEKNINLEDLGSFINGAKEAGIEPDELGYKVAIAAALVDELSEYGEVEEEE